MRKILILSFILGILGVPGAGHAVDPECSSPFTNFDFITPTAGEVWEAGQEYTISWDITCAPDDAWVGYIYLYENKSDENTDIVSELSVQHSLKGSLSWNVPADIVSSDAYDLNIEIFTGTIQNAQYEEGGFTEEFTINGVEPSEEDDLDESTGVVFLSPSGGESYNTGQILPISWRVDDRFLGKDLEVNLLLSRADLVENPVLSSVHEVTKIDYPSISQTEFSFNNYTVPSNIDTSVYHVNVQVRVNEPFDLAFGQSSTFRVNGTSIPPSEKPHLVGTLVNDNGVVSEIGLCGKSTFPSISVFRSYNHKFSEAVQANQKDRELFSVEAKYADGDLIADNGAVYIVYRGSKYGLNSREVFEGLGYSFENVFPGDLSDYTEKGLMSDPSVAHAYGTLINIDGTIYQTSISSKAPIPSLAVFNSHKFRFSRVVSGNEADKKLFTAAPLKLRAGTLADLNGGIYYIGPSFKTPIPDIATFQSLGFSFDRVIEVSETDLAPFADGPFEFPSDSLFGCLGDSVQSRNAKRLADIRQLQTALELYYNDNFEYPSSLLELVSTYISALPVPPEPADGQCSIGQNLYVYSRKSEDQSYELTFCLGTATGGLNPGTHIASPGGIQ